MVYKGKSHLEMDDFPMSSMLFSDFPVASSYGGTPSKQTLCFHVKLAKNKSSPSHHHFIDAIFTIPSWVVSFFVFTTWVTIGFTIDNPELDNH